MHLDRRSRPRLVRLVVAAGLCLACGGDGGPEIVDPGLHPPPAPAAPEGMDGAPIEGTIAFGWAVSPGASRYQLQIAEDPAFTRPIEAQVGVPAYQPPFRLSPGEYVWRVRAGNDAGWGPWSATWALTVLPAPPGAPGLVRPADGTETTGNRPVFEWAQVAGATEYEFQLDNSIDFGSPDAGGIVPVNSFTAPTLVPRVYYWRVRARNAGGWGAWSPRWSLTLVQNRRTLVAATSGAGTLVSEPAGLSIPAGSSTGSGSFLEGTTVTLVATPSEGWRIEGWGGACGSAGAAARCDLTMTSDRAVSVEFRRPVQTLSVTTGGQGSLTSSPAGIALGPGQGAGVATFDRGTAVTLTATPSAGWTVESWGGACSGAAGGPTCDLVLSEDRSVSVTFGRASWALDVTASGSGGVTSSPAGVTLTPGDGSTAASFTDGTVVVLTAMPARGWRVASWGGDCAAAGAAATCSLDMTADRTASVTFAAVPRTLVVSSMGMGGVVSSPSGIALPSGVAADTASFGDATSVTLTAVPDPGWQVQSWGGACTGSPGSTTCTLTLTADTTASVVFTPASLLLTVTTSGDGSVTSTPMGISIPRGASGDTATFVHGTVVTLDASAAKGWGVASWGGPCAQLGTTGGNGSCALTLAADDTVSVTFVDKPRTLTVTTAGGGHVTSNPAGIDCGGDCTEIYAGSTAVDLAAVPDPGWVFAGWGGRCSGTGACSVDMDRNRSVTALFVVGVPTLVAPADGAAVATAVAFVWSSVAGAVDYEIQVDDQAGFGSPLSVVVPSLTWTLAAGQPPGSYQWRVRARAPDAGTGTWGAWSAVRTLIIP